MPNIIPNPLRIEFELTNYCNAKCEFCPRFNIAEYGHMDIEKYEVFIKKLSSIKSSLWVHGKDERFPIIVFGGYGESLIHPKVFEFIRIAKTYGFKTELITNGLLLTKENCSKLLNSGLDNLSISLHTLDPGLNYKITGLADVIPNIKNALDYFDDKDSIAIEIWRVSGLDGSMYNGDDTKAYDKFLYGYNKKIKVFGPTPAWNRGGQFNSFFHPLVNDSPDIRCEVAYFTWSVSYNGEMVKCCCDFSSKEDLISSAWDLDLDNINKNIEGIEMNFPKMCIMCRRSKVDYQNLIK